MESLYITVGVAAFAAIGVALVGRRDVRSWAAAGRGRAWTRRVGVLGVLVAGVATAVFPSSPPQGIVAYFAAGALAFGSACLAAAGAAGTVEQGDGARRALGPRLRGFWRAAAREFRVTRYGLAVAGVSFLLAALTGGVAVDSTLSTVGALSFGGLLAVLGGLTAVGALVPGSGAATDRTAAQAEPADAERADEAASGMQDDDPSAATAGSENKGEPPR